MALELRSDKPAGRQRELQCHVADPWHHLGGSRCTAHKVWQVNGGGTTSLGKVGYRKQLPWDNGHISWLVLPRRTSRQSPFHVADQWPHQRAFQKCILVGVRHWMLGPCMPISDAGRVTLQDSVSGTWSTVPLVLDATERTWAGNPQFLWALEGQGRP